MREERDTPDQARHVSRAMRELGDAHGRDAVASDVAAARLGARQHAMVATRQLVELGLDKDDIRRRVRAGRLHPYFRGVYSLVPRQALPPLAREQAALLAAGPDAVLSHRSAAAVWGLVKPDRTTVDVIAPTHKRNRPGIKVHRTADLEPRHVRTKERLPLTSPYRSVLDLAPELSARDLDHAVSNALSQKLITDEEAQTLVDTPTITRSEAERRLKTLIKKAGLPTPQMNVKVEGWEVDFYWPDKRIAVEVNGFQFHGHRQAFEDDHRKILALERAGIHVIRISWRQLVDEPELVVASLARAL